MGNLGFWTLAQNEPDWVALVEADGKEHRAGELRAAADRLVHGLRARGLVPGDVIATVLPNGRAWVEVFLAVSQAGWYLTPINAHLAAPEIAHIVRDCEARAFVVHARHRGSVMGAAADIPVPEQMRFAVGGGIPGFRPYAELGEGQPDSQPRDRRSGTTMHYTSGTTGRPKGVRRQLPAYDPDTYGELQTMLLNGLFGIPPREGNVHLVAAPLNHTAVAQFGGAALHSGHTLVLMDAWDPEEALGKIERYRCTYTHMVPTMFRRLLGLPEDVRKAHDISSMRWAIHGAAPCPTDVKQAMLDWWGPVVYEYYGSTEGGGAVATPEDWLARPGTVGKPWPVTELRILDDAGEQVPTGAPGTVYMRMATADFDFEYKDDAEKTRAGRRDGFFTVGDIGYLDADGYLYLCDRKADVIISGGVNIYPAEIESEILRHPGVSDVAVFGVPDDDWGEQIKAVVEPVPGAEAGEELAEGILASLDGRLAKLKWPKAIDFIDVIPRDPYGKLIKRELRDRYWAGRDRAI
ncbi:acyl-CoA synthetase [Wenjunlia tyrosinilytica]|uniref:Acyl-CoA synthetase n=1 Tax=Wenjunlia tyrosinilytica TaxID=1544741 RepID=A0A918E1K9_9ACTN|nr:acyl-CoA synthetase [Wenjunlia tyrosinilytica]GGO96628.1 acyl-CoA synthetase [Wenjunlia tyrosinilytica]